MRNGKCPICGEYKPLQKHHKFSQAKWARKIYKSLIDHVKNLLYICSDCHLNKPIPKWTEKEFCEALGITCISKVAKHRRSNDTRTSKD
jgi:hypothetical protein